MAFPVVAAVTGICIAYFIVFLFAVGQKACGGLKEGFCFFYPKYTYDLCVVLYVEYPRALYCFGFD